MRVRLVTFRCLEPMTCFTDDGIWMRTFCVVAPVLWFAAAACSPAAPAIAPGAGVAPEVRLVDSIPFEDEMGDGVLRRVEVRAGGRLDTIPGVLTLEAPMVLGDTSIVGFAYRDGLMSAVYRYDPRTRLATHTPIPSDMSPVMSVPTFSPDGRHIAYVSFHDGKGRLVVRTWPEGERLLRSEAVDVPGTDAPGGHRVRWVSPDQLEVFVETGSSTENAWYRVRASLNPARIISADTVSALPD